MKIGGFTLCAMIEVIFYGSATVLHYSMELALKCIAGDRFVVEDLALSV